MPDAVQFLVTPSYESSVAMAMQAVCRRYVETFNRRHGRRGAMWRGEYRATVIEPDRYFLLASQVIDHAPVRNHLVAEPGNYPWSSYTHHVGLRVDRFIKDHPLYRALGDTPFERHESYRDLGVQPLDEAEVSNLMRATLEGWVLGSAAYCEWAAQTANRRLMPLLLRDRPSKVRTASAHA
jgi:putative transposase